jgi:hypothetical protein
MLKRSATLKSDKLPSEFGLVTPTTVPDFQVLRAVEVRFLAIKTAVETAQQITSDKPEVNAGVKKELAAKIGLGLDAIT